MLLSRDQSYKLSPSQNSDTQQREFEPMQNLDMTLMNKICSSDNYFTLPWGKNNKTEKKHNNIKKIYDSFM